MLPKTSVPKHTALRGRVEGEDSLIAPIEEASVDQPQHRYAVIELGHDLVESQDYYIGTLDRRGQFHELQWFSLFKGAKVEVNNNRYPWD